MVYAKRYTDRWGDRGLEAMGNPFSEIDAASLAFPIAEAGGFGPGRATMLHRLCRYGWLARWGIVCDGLPPGGTVLVTALHGKSLF
jgi:hypothetical protein